jgi:molybdopterin-guanine dinucleotide biosynthesis protein A
MIAGLVLAGGRSSRFGSEKAVALYGERPMLDRGLDVLRAGCGALAVSAAAGSGAAALARRHRLPVLADDPGDPDGPLSGVLAGLVWAAGLEAAHLATVPCDMPGLPADMIERLSQALGDAPGVSVRTGAGRQPLCALWSVTLAHSLREALAQGHPSVQAFQDAAGMALASFEDETAFANLNRPAG